jgi:hypothetical protein
MKLTKTPTQSVLLSGFSVTASVNAINLPRLEAYIKSVADDHSHIPLVAKWITSNLRNWLLRDNNPYKIHLKSRNQFSMLGIHQEPPWLKGKDLPPNLYFITLNPRLKGDVEVAVNHLVYQVNVLGVKDISKVSVDDAIAKGDKQAEDEYRAAVDEHYESEGIQLVAPVSEGFKWVMILTKPGLMRESKHMGHCLGKPGHVEGYWQRLNLASSKILSLRDNHNKPHVTIEYIVANKMVLQIRAKGAAEVPDLRAQFEPMHKRYQIPTLELFTSDWGREHIKKVMEPELARSFPEMLWRSYIHGVEVIKPAP